MFIVTEMLYKKWVVKSVIRSEVEGSDHCPVELHMRFNKDE